MQNQITKQIEAAEQQAEKLGCQWSRERARIAAGKGEGKRFVAMAVALTERAGDGSKAVRLTFGQANAAMGLDRKIGPAGAASWRTLLQRAKQTDLAESGCFLGWRIDAEAGAFEYTPPAHAE